MIIYFQPLKLILLVIIHFVIYVFKHLCSVVFLFQRPAYNSRIFNQFSDSAIFLFCSICCQVCKNINLVLISFSTVFFTETALLTTFQEPILFNVNRPFLIMLRSRVLKTCLFVGRILNPQGNN